MPLAAPSTPITVGSLYFAKSFSAHLALFECLPIANCAYWHVISSVRGDHIIRLDWVPAHQTAISVGQYFDKNVYNAFSNSNRRSSEPIGF